jgi:hypothetical protein
MTGHLCCQGFPDSAWPISSEHFCLLLTTLTLPIRDNYHSHDAFTREMDRNLAVQEGIANVGGRVEVFEVMLLLPANQFIALEESAFRQNLSVARLLRRAIADFLHQPGSVGAGEVGT